MQNPIIIFIAIISSIFFVSCNTNEEISDKPACLLINSNNSYYGSTYNYVYDEKNRLISFLVSYKDCSLKYTLEYSGLNEVKLDYEGDCQGIIKGYFPAIFELNKEGKPVKIKIDNAASDTKIESELIYAGNQLKRFHTDFFVNKKFNRMTEFEIEYAGKNVSKVTKKATKTEDAVVFEGLKYDEMKEYEPLDKKIISLHSKIYTNGTGFDFLSENNPLEYIVRYGVADEPITYKFKYTYNEKGYPLSTSTNMDFKGSGLVKDYYSPPTIFEYLCK